MIACPSCETLNLPGSDTCSACEGDLQHIETQASPHMILRKLRSGKLAALISGSPTCVAPDEPVADVIRAIHLSGNPCALIESDGRLVGILTERDVLRKIANRYDEVAQEPVSKFMTASPESASPDHDLAFALNRMTAGGYRHLPIVRDDRAIGLVSVRDLLRFVVECFGETFPATTHSR